MPHFSFFEQEARERLSEVRCALGNKCHVCSLNKEVGDFRIFLEFHKHVAQIAFLKLELAYFTATRAHFSESVSQWL